MRNPVIDVVICEIHFSLIVHEADMLKSMYKRKMHESLSYVNLNRINADL